MSFWVQKFEDLSIKTFEIKEIWEPEVIVSLHGLEGLGFT